MTAFSKIDGTQIKSSSIDISHIDISTVNKALITKLVAGNSISIASTGIDVGTGNVTVNAFFDLKLNNSLISNVLKLDFTDTNNIVFSLTNNGILSASVVNGAVINKTLSGLVPVLGSISENDTILSAFNKAANGLDKSLIQTFSNDINATSTSTGAVVLSSGGLGVYGDIWAGSIQGTPIGSSTRSTGAFTSLSSNSTTILSPVNTDVTISPTGTGKLTINPASLSSINNTSIGASTRSTGAFTTLAANSNTTMTANISSTTTATGTLVVTGGIGVSENLNIGGNLIVNGNLTIDGTSTIINSTVQQLVDPIIVLGSGHDGADLIVNDNKDRGIQFQWFDVTNKTGFFGFDRSTQYFTFISEATITSEVASGTLGDIQASNFRGALIGNSSTSTKLANARSISITGDLAFSISSFDGSGDVTAIGTLATVCASPGTFSSIVVNGKGLVTSGSNPGYLLVESDTLQTVMNRGATSTVDLQLSSASLILTADTAKILTKAIAPAIINTNSMTAIDSWDTTKYRSVKYTIQVVQNLKYQMSEVLLLHDTEMTEFAIVENSPNTPIPVAFSSSIDNNTNILTFSATISDAFTTSVSILMHRTLFSL